MAEHYRFFDSTAEDTREYNAQEFTDYFKALVTTGVMKGAGNQLAVSANGSNMVTTVDTGIAFILGRYYENDSPLQLTHDTESLGVSRIDRIVVRLDLNTDKRYVRTFIKKGTPSANPVPPSLQRDNLVYEISLAQVLIVGGQTYINADDVKDEREDEAVCGWAGSKILPNFNDDKLEELINTQMTNKGIAKFYDGDLNELTITGFYYSEGMSTDKNFPINLSSSYHVLIEVVNFNGWILQRLYTKTPSGNEYIYERSMLPYDISNGRIDTWYPWKRFRNQEDWIKVDLINGYISSGYSTLKTQKDEINKIVRLRGIVTSSSSSNNYFGILPEGYRPKAEIAIPIYVYKGDIILGNFEFKISFLRISKTGYLDLVITYGDKANYVIDTYFLIN